MTSTAGILAGAVPPGETPAASRARKDRAAFLMSPDETLAIAAREGNGEAIAELRRRYPVPGAHSAARRAFLRSPDETLADAARHGDAGALAELRARYRRHAIGYIRQHTAYADTGALADEAFADVLDQLGRLDTTAPGAFRRWLDEDILPAVTANRARPETAGE
jgi:hypothetical protein